MSDDPIQETASEGFERIIQEEHTKHLEEVAEKAANAYDEYVYKLAMKVADDKEITKDDVYGYLESWWRFRRENRAARGSDTTPLDNELNELQEDREKGTLRDTSKETLDYEIKKLEPRDKSREHFEKMREQIRNNKLAREFFSGDNYSTSVESAISNTLEWKEWMDSFTPLAGEALKQGRALFD